MPLSRRAVFLSYARGDTDAAHRIAEALRGFGIEAWFDQDELRGGDAWDAKIRKQIKECTLFLPIISAQTQERTEGYFRLEWDLAEERTHLMAKGVPFLLPVVIDETAEADAIVPDRFRGVQWTTLPGGNPTPQFVERVTRLLATPRGTSALESGGQRTGGGGGQRTDGGGQRMDGGRPAKWIMVAAAVGILGAGGYFALRPAGETAPVSANSKVQTPGSKLESRASAKSLAVLPFANRSASEDDAFFVDGMHDDILTNLARIRELQVTSRTSVEQYRATKKPIPEIARELRVAYILEGSVQRAGSTVRITGQLIDARTDGHVWAQTFDRQLTPANLFAIQSELAQAIAREMKAAISPDERKQLARRPTENLAAYDLFLKARAERNRGIRTPAAMNRLEVLYQAPVTLDPNFGLPWAELSWVHAYKYFLGYDRSSARMVKARLAMEHAVRLAPGEMETILAVGYYHYFCSTDYPKALEQFEAAVQLQPHHIDAGYAVALIQMRTARWLEARENFRRAAEVDPSGYTKWTALARIANHGRRYEESISALERAVTLEGGSQYADDLALITFLARGSRTEMEAYFASLPPDIQLRARLSWAGWTGNPAEVLRLDQKLPPESAAIPPEVGRVLTVAVAFAAQGRLEAGSERLKAMAERLRRQIDRDEVEPSHAWANLGMIEAMLGNREEARRSARKAVEIMPVSRDAETGPRRLAALAFVQAWTGETEAALATYAGLLRMPATSWGGADVNVHIMKHDLRFAPLRDDPRFQALLDDPKNNAPLF